MNEFTVQAVQIETTTALHMNQKMHTSTYPANTGLDVHKETIAVAVARSGRPVPESQGKIKNSARRMTKLVERLAREFGGEVLLFCHEARPHGCGLYRQLLTSEHEW